MEKGCGRMEERRGGKAYAGFVTKDSFVAGHFRDGGDEAIFFGVVEAEFSAS